MHFENSWKKNYSTTSHQVQLPEESALKNHLSLRFQKTAYIDTSKAYTDERLRYTGTRKRFGDMEVDFVVSGKGGSGILLVVVDRKSRLVFLRLLRVVKIEYVHDALLSIQKKYPTIKSITLDNDILFRKHKELASLLGVPLYFCHPYHSWEKGTVENANKYIRRDIPKGRDLSKYSDEYIQSLEDKLNRRSMKCLNYKTPTEVLNE